MAATAEATNKVTVTDSGPCSKRLTIEIPAEVVSGKLKESFDALSSEAALPGFRKGRVPRSLLEKKFGDTVKNEAKNQLVASAYAAAVDEQKLQVLGEPSSESLAGVAVKDGQPLVVELDVEVLPQFELPSLESIPVKKPTFEVTDAAVEDEIKKAQINEGKLESRETPEPGDYLTGHAIMVGADGTEFYNITGAVVQIPLPDKGGKGMILGVMVDDFSKQFGQPKAGETATVKVRGPENHEVEKLRAVDLTITFAVDRVDRIIPATMEELLKASGHPGEGELRDFVAQQLNQRAIVDQLAAMRTQVARYLIENTKIDLPPKMTAAQAQRTLERRRMELMYRGVQPQVIEERISELRAASAGAAARELKLFFITNKAAEQLQVKVQDAEINGRIVQMARARNVRPDALRQELASTNRIGLIYQQVREHKTLDAILAKAQVTEVTEAEYEKSAKEE